MALTPFGIRKRIKSALGLGPKEPMPKRPEVPRFAVTFTLPDGSSYEVQAKQGDTLVMASGRGPAPIATGCADSSCGTCQVEVLEGAESLTAADEAEAETKKANAVPEAHRLGCRAEVTGPGLKVHIVNVLGEGEFA